MATAQTETATAWSSTPSPAELVAFEARLAESRAREAKSAPVERYVDGQRVVWAPQPGSQELFLSCPIIEALFHGTRGPGKTDALLMSFAQHVGKGYGAAWRGIIFRETYPQLADVQAKSERWFRQIFPRAEFNRQTMSWRFDTGEVLFLRWMRQAADYWNFHGHEYPFIGWEELTNWADPACFKSMMSCNRSSTPGVPRMIRATTNPYGVGHNWVKERYRLHGKWWETIVIIDSRDENGNLESPRCAIHGHIDENRILLAADPNYKQAIATSALNQAMADAWLHGSWNLIAGGMFSDVWSHAHNNLPRFEIPHAWPITRAFDWGSSKPFSVGWYAQSDGGDLKLSNGRTMATVKGDLFRVREWYGWTGRANEGRRMLASEIAEGIVERELAWGWRQGDRSRVRRGPADAAIYKVENGNCIATDMLKPVRINGNVYRGIDWTPSDKSPGSRKNGWELMRKAIRAAQPGKGPREHAGLFIIGDECPQFIRTVLSLPRDEKDLDDVDTEAEDHVADEVRYRVRALGQGVGSGTTTGMY